MILGLFTGVLGAGGIERISRHTAAVLAAVAREQGVPCFLLSLNDPSGRHRVEVGDFTFTIQGFGREKGRFLLSLLTAPRRTSLTYIGHPNLAPLGLVLRLIQPSVRYWVATYGIDVWQPLPFFRRLGLRSAYAVTAVSKFTAEKAAVVQKLKPVKVTVVPPAIDPEFLRMYGVGNSECPIPSGRVLLTVARLAASEKYKGVETVLQALPKLLRIIPDTYYVIVGDGDDRPQLECLAREMGLDNHVIFAGQKFGSDLLSYYKACDVYVMPSRAEGFGVVFLEAMAMGKPVIGGNHGGTPEVVLDGVTGFLVNHGDVDTLADRLILLLNDEDLRKRMGEAGRRRVREHYSFEHFLQRLSQVLTGGNPCVS